MAIFLASLALPIHTFRFVYNMSERISFIELFEKKFFGIIDHYNDNHHQPSSNINCFRSQLEILLDCYYTRI